MNNSFHVLRLLPWCLVALVGLGGAQVTRAESCDSRIGGPEPKTYEQMVKDARIRYDIDRAGKATVTNMSGCPLVVRFSSMRLTENGKRFPYSATELVTVPSGKVMTMKVHVPSCAYVLRMQPYYDVQYDKKKKPLLQETYVEDLPQCAWHVSDAPASSQAIPSGFMAQASLLEPLEKGGQKNCVIVRTVAFDDGGDRIIGPQQDVYVTLDGKKSKWTDGNGFAVFTSVKEGIHTVSQSLPDEWVSVSVQPSESSVYVHKNAQCPVVQFANKPSADHSGSFRVDVRLKQNVVRPGQQVQMEVVLTNDEARLKLVTVEAAIDEALTILSADGNARFLPHGVLQWKSVGVPGNSTRILKIYGYVPSQARVPASVMIRVEAEDQLRSNVIRIEEIH